ncbi:hypothetical protein [Streptacidiphilus melanogenes]|uniref:hypothetical protein n=1 Tax=Streptacidiphilus melanogenes TaxID=411235 RepID=UPI0013649FFC|nr:hypothetical protein [Streptacidiphilus melanogenes]
MAGERPAGASGEQCEPVVEPLADLLDGQHRQPPRRQLQRQRDPVETAAERGDLLGVAGCDGEAGEHGRGPLREQRHRVGVRPLGGQRREREPLFALDPQRLAAAHQHLQPRRRREQARHQRRSLLDEVLAAVQHEQQAARREEVPQHLGRRARGAVGEPQRLRDGVAEQRRVGELGAGDQPRAVGEVRRGRRGGAQREPALADAAGARDRHQPVAAQHPLRYGQLDPATHEPRQFGGQISGAWHGTPFGGERSPGRPNELTDRQVTSGGRGSRGIRRCPGGATGSVV